MTCAASRRWQASSTRRSGSGKPVRSRCASSARARSVCAKRASIPRAVGLSGETAASPGAGVALRGSRSRASRLAGSGVARQVARKASASRERRPCRSMTAASRGCSPRGTVASVAAVVAESRPSSTCRARSGASRRPRVRRRSTQPRPRSRSRAICAGDSWSSSLSERTTRASSIGLRVRRGALASSSRALATTPGASSTTTGTCVCPSRTHWVRRLKPSSTS